MRPRWFHACPLYVLMRSIACTGLHSLRIGRISGAVAIPEVRVHHAATRGRLNLLLRGDDHYRVRDRAQLDRRVRNLDTVRSGVERTGKSRSTRLDKSDVGIGAQGTA